MNDRIRVALASGFGALIGGFIALQFSGFWAFVGVVTGAMVGYVTYNIKEIGQAVVENVNEIMTQGYFDKTVLSLKTGLIRSVKSLLSGLSFASIPVAYALIIRYSFDNETVLTMNLANASYTFGSLEVALFIIAFSGIIMTLMISVGLLIKGSQPFDYKINEEQYNELTALSSHLKVNFATIPLFWLPYGIWFVLKNIAIVLWKVEYRKGLSVVARFVKSVAIQIHSKARLVCACDAALGSAAGYFMGDAIMGFVVGTAFGFLHYEFSKRVLKIVPATN